jgi:histone acetyltransferase MCC1
MHVSTSSAFPDEYEPIELYADIHQDIASMIKPGFGVENLFFRTVADPRELDDIRALHAEWFPVQYNDEFYDSLVSQTGDVVVVVASLTPTSHIVGMVSIAIRRKESRFNPSGDLTGHLGLSPDEENTAYVLTLGVIDELRKMGIANKLLEKGLTQVTACDPGCRVVYLHVIEYNKPAFSLYRKLGFHEYDTYSNFYIIDSVGYGGTLFYKPIGIRPSAVSAISLMGKWLYRKIRAFVGELRQRKPKRPRPDSEVSVVV